MARRGEIQLGDTVKDTITGLEGVVICLSNWLNGCERCIVQPKELKDGKPVDASHFDVEQVDVTASAQPLQRTKTGGPQEDAVRGQEARR